MSNIRKVVASGSIKIKDDEIFSDEYGYLDTTSAGVVSPNQPSVKLVNTSKCVGGEVRFELDLDAIHQDNDDVRISGEARLFEGSDCNTNDLEDTQSVNLIVPKDGSASYEIKVESTGVGGGDYAKGRVTFTNTSQPTR